MSQEPDPVVQMKRQELRRLLRQTRDERPRGDLNAWQLGKSLPAALLDTSATYGRWFYIAGLVDGRALFRTHGLEFRDVLPGVADILSRSFSCVRVYKSGRQEGRQTAYVPYGKNKEDLETLLPFLQLRFLVLSELLSWI